MNMKKSIVVLSVLFSFLMASPVVNAQSKLGHVNSQEVLSMMPDYKEMQELLAQKEKELRNELQELQAMYQQKAAQLEGDISDTKREVIISDLTDLEQRMQQRQISAQQDLEELNQKLQKPIVKKIQNAIKAVSEEGKYTYVFDKSALMYFDGGDDITDKVKAKLNINGKTGNGAEGNTDGQ